MDNRPYEEQGRIIRGARKAKHLSQKELGKLIGVTQQEISNIECGNNDAGPDVKENLEKVLGIQWTRPHLEAQMSQPHLEDQMSQPHLEDQMSQPQLEPQCPEPDLEIQSQTFPSNENWLREWCFAGLVLLIPIFLWILTAWLMVKCHINEQIIEDSFKEIAFIFSIYLYELLMFITKGRQNIFWKILYTKKEGNSFGEYFRKILS